MFKTKIEAPEAINNIEINDFSPTLKGKITMSEFLELQREYEKISNCNEIKISAKIKEKDIIKGKEIIDKSSGMPIIDDNGVVKTYPDTYKLTLVFEGGSMEYRCKASQYEQLEINNRYLFSGYYGLVKEFGKDVLNPIFTDIQAI